MSNTSWIYPTSKMLGSRTVWVWEDWMMGEFEFFLPQEEKSDTLRVVRITDRRRIVHRISGGTEEARKRLLRKCQRLGIQAFID